VKTRTEKSQQLFELAESQQGYFTSADAKGLGYDYPHQFFHVKRRNWIRVDRSIYRLKNFPAAPHEDLMRWWLWSRKKAVLSHETAAALYELGGLLPSKIHLTVPPDFRKRPSKSLIIHKAKLRESEIEKRDGLPVTNPLRTILDLARSHLDDERLEAVARDAILKGFAGGKELLSALVTTPKGIDPATQTTLRLAARVGAERSYASRSTVDELPQVREESVGSLQSGLDVRGVLGELKGGLQLVYGDRLRGVYLFGSYARREADRESDLDILVVLDAFDRYAHEVNRTGALAADLSLKYGVTVSLVFLREHEWLKGDTPFLSNVRDEAIPA
jgi:predicted transcriptional regulator of viral defense system